MDRLKSLEGTKGRVSDDQAEMITELVSKGLSIDAIVDSVLGHRRSGYQERVIKNLFRNPLIRSNPLMRQTYGLGVYHD